MARNVLLCESECVAAVVAGVSLGALLGFEAVIGLEALVGSRWAYVSNGFNVARTVRCLRAGAMSHPDILLGAAVDGVVRNVTEAECCLFFCKST